MVASVTDSSLASGLGALGRPAQSGGDAPINVNTKLRREVAITAKFGPDPETGSPLQIISGKDVELAENNDLQRLSEANLGASSAETAFQTTSISSAETSTAESGAASSQALQVARSASTDSDGGSSGDFTPRGSTVDVQV